MGNNLSVILITKKKDLLQDIVSTINKKIKLLI